MKVNFTKIKSLLSVQFTLALVIVFVGCKSVDNFDPFSLFDDGKEKDVNGFRNYSNHLNQAPLVEFIMDKSDPISINLNDILKKTCEYSKIPYEAIEIKKWDSAFIIRPTTRVICVTETKKLSQRSIDKIIEFVASGGTLFVPYSPSDRRISYLVGIKPEAEYDTDIKSMGFHFNTPYLPGLKGIDLNRKSKGFETDVTLYGLAQENFSDKIKILATATNNPNMPSIFTNQIGDGHVILINTANGFEKKDRGLCFAAILSGLEGIPYPVANTSTIFLDDFPSPLYNAKVEPIASEMNLGMREFVQNVWWPDMKGLAKKYNISYSAMTCFDYKNKVEPPFIFDQWDLNKIKYDRAIIPLAEAFAHDLVKNKHELAFHGYNHVEYYGNLWKNQDFVGPALNSVKKKWELSRFGNFPVTYVPPSDIIDDRGIDKLKREMPSLKYLCSVYNGEVEDGGNREFDFDPNNNGFFDYPRITYGFHLGNQERFNQQSVYLFTGIWTHFVHPDDVYQIKSIKNMSQGNFDLRNALGLGWHKTNGQNRGLYSELDNYLKEVTTYFPQMRFLNAGTAANIVLDWRASNFKYYIKNGTCSVAESHPEQSISNDQYWFLYVSAENSKKMEAEFKGQVAKFSKTPFLEGFLYMLFTKKSQLSLPDLKYKSKNQEIAMEDIIKRVKDDYKDYQQKVLKFHNGNEKWVDDSEIKFKRELDSLKQKMITDVKIDSVTWNRYTKYMLWDDKGAEVWSLFEDHIKKYPSTENILYSKELSKTNDYPTNAIKEKWLSAQIELAPNDQNALLDYINSFDTPENKEKIKKAYENLIAVDHSFETRLLYLQYLLLNEPKTALCDLDAITPCEEYKAIASEVAWLYSDNNEVQKSYDWSLYSAEIDFATKMSWLMELKSYDLLEAEYKKYIVENDDDYKAKAVMAEYYHSKGRFKDAWIIGTLLPDSPEKTSLKLMLNNDVKYVDMKLQEDLIHHFSEFFDPKVKSELIKTNRLESGNFCAYNNSLESNRQYLSCFKNVFSYNFYNKNTSLNSVAFTYSKMYNLKYAIEDADNITHTIFGLQYQYNSSKIDDRWKYWSKARVEYSDYDNFYFHFGLGANLSKNKKYTSAEIKIFPAENGPCYSKGIYRIQSNLYNDIFIFNKINTSFSFEGNFYTKSKTNTTVKTNNSFEGTLTGKATWDNGLAKKTKWLPFVEISYLRSHIGDSTLDLSLGYPYWIINERFYSGGGLGWKFRKTNFSTQLEASWFYDTYSIDFKRFTGMVTYQIFDFTALTANLEVYSQSKFYSNVIQFGVKYNMKKKFKR